MPFTSSQTGFKYWRRLVSQLPCSLAPRPTRGRVARGGGWIPCPVASFHTYLGINLSWGQWRVCAGLKPGQSHL